MSVSILIISSGSCHTQLFVFIDRLTKGGIPNQCSWLEGTITFAKDELARKVDSYVFKYVLTEGPPVKKANGTPKDNKNKLDEFKEGLRDYQIGMIPKLGTYFV